MNGLSKEDKELWARYTADVTPLSDSPTSPNERQSVFKATQVVRNYFGASLDLHGYSVQDAYDAVHQYLEEVKGKYRAVVIITGLSGQINVEFPRWFEHHPDVRSIKPMNGGGAWEVCLKKNIT